MSRGFRVLLFFLTLALGPSLGAQASPPAASIPQANAPLLSEENLLFPAPKKPEEKSAPQSQNDSPAPVSPLEQLYRTSYANPLAEKLSQFGYGMFRSDAPVPATAAPGPDYVLGPGDELRILLTTPEGAKAFRVRIAPDGSVALPGAGKFALAGVRYGQSEEAVAKAASAYLTGVRVSVTLERLRDIQIYVVGEVRRPGLTKVPAFSTVISGLVAGGGVSKNGSLRAIRLKRGDGGARDVDLYDLLLKGERKDDVFLRDRDVLFVPRIGRTAAVAGTVGRPGIFELREEESLADLLALGGGMLPQGYTGRIHVSRFRDGRSFEVLDIRAADKAALTQRPLADGDLLTVRHIPETRPQTVSLKGHVISPEVFRYRPGLQLSDILTGPELLKPEAVTDFAMLMRYDEASTRSKAVTFPLAATFRGDYDAPLSPRDEIVVLSRKEYGIRETVTLNGAVWQEGEFDCTEDMRLVDLLALGGGLRFGADTTRIKLSRKLLRDGRAETEFLNLDLAESRNFRLQPFDCVNVPRMKDADSYLTAEINGEVKYPGTYRIRRGDRLSDLIRRAGGFTGEAYFFGARFTSAEARNIQQQSIDRLIRDLELRASRILSEQGQTASSMEEAESAESARLGLAKLIGSLKTVRAEGRIIIRLTSLADFADSQYDFTLTDGDVLEIPPKPSFVSVVGSVYSPSSFLFAPRGTVGDYLNRSGGPTREADTKRMYVLRSNGEVLSRRQGGTFVGRFESLRLMPGDTLVVPEDLERVPYFRLVKGLTDIVFKIATTAGIAIAIL